MLNRILIAGVVLMAMLVLFLMAGAIPVDHGKQVVIFQTPAFVTVAFLGGVVMLIACFRRQRPFRQVAFVLSHAGLVLLMAGAFIDWRGEKRIDGVRLPVAMGHAVGRLRDLNGNAVDLGFTLAVQKFSVNYYDPVYSLNRPDSSHSAKGDGYVMVTTVDPRVPSSLRQVPVDSMSVATLNPQGAWLQEVALSNGWILRKQKEIPRWFEAEVQITVNGDSQSRRLAVNHPLLVNGWQILLVSYGTEPIRYVELAFKQSPGHRLVVGGIWVVLVGVFMLCFIKPIDQESSHATT